MNYPAQRAFPSSSSPSFPKLSAPTFGRVGRREGGRRANPNVLLPVLVAHNVDGLLDLAQHHIAVRVVCLPSPISNVPGGRGEEAGFRTCRRPRNSRSPRSFTNTSSSSDSRTRSSGSEMGFATSLSAISVWWARWVVGWLAGSLARPLLVG